MELKELKSVEIIAKEYFDNVNANSYFSAHVIINEGLKSEERILIPFQYGYGSQYEYVVFEMLKKRLLIFDKNLVSWRFYKENQISYKNTLYEGYSKKEVTKFGLNL